MRVSLLACALLAAVMSAPAGAATDDRVFSLRCLGRMYDFVREQVVGFKGFDALLTIDLDRMRWVRTGRGRFEGTISRVRGSWIFLVEQEPAEKSPLITESINRATLKYQRTVEIAPFREATTARCKTVPLVPIEGKAE